VSYADAAEAYLRAELTALEAFEYDDAPRDAESVRCELLYVAMALVESELDASRWQRVTPALRVQAMRFACFPWFGALVDAAAQLTGDATRGSLARATDVGDGDGSASNNAQDSLPYATTIFAARIAAAHARCATIQQSLSTMSARRASPVKSLALNDFVSDDDDDDGGGDELANNIGRGQSAKVAEATPASVSSSSAPSSTSSARKKRRVTHDDNRQEVVTKEARVEFNRSRGQIKFSWPQRELGSGKIVQFLVHWIGSDCLADFTYEQPDECNLSEPAYVQMLAEIPDARYMWQSFEELEELRERFKRTPSTSWQQLLAMDVGELWRGPTNASRRAACETKRLKLIDEHVGAAWHVRGDTFLVHWRANEKERKWNKHEFEWLAHGFATLHDRRLHERAALLTPKRTYPWRTGDQALALISSNSDDSVLEYEKKPTIQDLMSK